MKVLFTGSSGFIGKYIYQQLLGCDHELLCISREKRHSIHHIQADILDHVMINKIIESFKPEILIHLAWNVEHGKYWESDLNYMYAEASKNIIASFIRNGGKKIISVGTSAEYEQSANHVTELHINRKNLSIYGACKSSVYEFMRENCVLSGVEFTWARIFGVYGVGENKARLIPSALSSISNNENFELVHPDIFMDYIYAGDIAEFIVSSIELDGLGPVNMGSGHALSVQDIYKTLDNYVKTKEIVLFDSIQTPNEKSRIPDCTKLKKFGFDFKFGNGLEKMIAEIQ